MIRGKDAERLRRMAALGWWGCALSAIGLIVATWSYIWTQPIHLLVAPLGFPSLEHAAPWQFVVVRGFACASSAAGAAALWALGICFRSMVDGNSFAAMATALPRFAVAVLLAAVVSVATPPLSSLILSIGVGPGDGRLVLTLSANHAVAVLVALAFYILARMFREAARIEREMRRSYRRCPSSLILRWSWLGAGSSRRTLRPMSVLLKQTYRC